MLPYLPPHIIADPKPVRGLANRETPCPCCEVIRPLWNTGGSAAVVVKVGVVAAVVVSTVAAVPVVGAVPSQTRGFRGYPR